MAKTDKKKSGWISPDYTMSRCVNLDPETIAGNRCVAILSEAPEVESYRVLRTRILQRTREKGGNAVMVTSALPGEGKTLTAINLALTVAREFKQTVLLVDCDLKQQKLQEFLGISNDRGLADYLLDDCPVTDLFVWPGIEKLTLVFSGGGRTVEETSELLGSPKMRDLVADMRGRYPERYIFFDVPPILTGADAMAFAPLVDYILVVVQAGQTSVRDVKRALQLLPGEKVLGLVLNRQDSEAGAARKNP